MSKFQILRASVNQRLSLAAEEIFELFERTIAEYEEERQQRELKDVSRPQIHIHRAGREDVQQLLVSREELPPEQQEWSPHDDQEDTEAPHIKEEQEELWSSQEGEQLQEFEEAGTTNFCSRVFVKSEEDEEIPQSSKRHQRKREQMEAGVYGCGTRLQPEVEVKIDDSSDAETDVSSDDQEESEHNLGFNPSEFFKDRNSHYCSNCGKAFNSKGLLTRHMKTHTKEKPFSCSECGKRFQERHHVISHMTFHTGEKPFSCSICGEKFGDKSNLTRHLRTHTGEKPFSCSECGKRFNQKQHVTSHMLVHTGEKPFSCSECNEKFKVKSLLIRHIRTHTGEKPFSCSVCGKRFNHELNMKRHMLVHLGEKPFSCSVCSKSFTQNWLLTRHMRIHTGEKPFSCTECNKSFSFKHLLTRHTSKYHGREAGEV